MNQSIRVLIVDDEPRARRGIALLLGTLEGFKVVGEAGSGESAVKQIQELRPELVFLDVQMPGLNGFEVLARIPRDELPVVVFVTAFDEYALKAFEFHAVDYLLKPFEDERFFAAVESARAQVRRTRAVTLQSKLLELLDSVKPDTAVVPFASPVGERTTGGPVPGALAERSGERVVLKNGGEVILLKSAEIDWIEADGDYMKFHVGGRSLLHRETMASLEARLDAQVFRRIHRSTIVNLDRIARLSPAFNGEHVVVLKDGTRLRLSKGYQDRLQDWLRQPT